MAVLRRVDPAARRHYGLRVLSVAAVLGVVLAFYVASAHPYFTARTVGRFTSLFGHNASGYRFSDAVTVSVDDAAAGKPISPYIYGVAGASGTTITALGATVNRWGGNPSSTYNWVQGNAWNAGRDWGFRNVDYSTGTSASSADDFIRGTLAAGAVPLMTIPTMGWVAADGNNQHQSVGVPAQGGAAVSLTGAVQGYDPAANRRLTSVPSLPSRSGASPGQSASTVYQDQWVSHLTSGFGAAAVPFLAMDNEPDLWSFTHADVHPAQPGYDDMLRNFLAYAGATRAADPSALILGPDVSGWTGYQYSALDRGTDAYATHADQAAHGGVAFLPWWLDQVRAQDQKSGRRTLNYLDVHYYPQAAGVGDDRTDAATQALRIRSTRSLWDPTYRDESWINQPVDLVPRLKAWVAADYPGTRLAITEYNWGGENDASGAVALAEVLGVFGREGVDLATYWTYPKPATPAGAAFRLYRNYDGHGATFGDSSLPASSSNPGIMSFAARHSDTGELDVLVVNQSQTQSATVRVRAPRMPLATAFVVDAGSASIQPVALDAANPSISLPALSVALVRLGGAR